MKRLDLIGSKFGRLTVTAVAGRMKGNLHWQCRCECGNETNVSTCNLRGGKVVSCGCFHSEQTTKRNTTHDSTKTPEFKAWCQMRARCSNPNNPAYKDYGGRGIRVCERWERSFTSFLEDMGPRPSPRHSIDRSCNDKGYEPGNCRWATHAEQSRNKRNNRWVNLNGRTVCIADWAAAHGVRPALIYQRLGRGWPLQRALSDLPGREVCY